MYTIALLVDRLYSPTVVIYIFDLIINVRMSDTWKSESSLKFDHSIPLSQACQRHSSSTVHHVHHKLVLGRPCAARCVPNIKQRSTELALTCLTRTARFAAQERKDSFLGFG